MGGNSSKQPKQQKQPKKVKKLTPEEQKKLTVDNNWISMGSQRNSNLVRDSNNHQGVIYEYILHNKYDPEDELLVHQRRKNIDAPIINVFDSQCKNDGSALQPINYIKAVTERIPHRLSESPQLTFSESLYVLRESLIGYQLLENKLGPFVVDSRMIGFTPDGRVKVWCNQNFGNNHPSRQLRQLKSTIRDSTLLNPSQNKNIKVIPDDECQMVKNVINVVGDHCEQGVFPDNFMNKMHLNGLGFSQAIAIVDDQLIKNPNERVNRVDLFRNMVSSRSVLGTNSKIPYNVNQQNGSQQNMHFKNYSKGGEYNNGYPEYRRK